MTWAITFGQKYRREPHPVLGLMPELADGWVTVTADTGTGRPAAGRRPDRHRMGPFRGESHPSTNDRATHVAQEEVMPHA